MPIPRVFDDFGPMFSVESIRAYVSSTLQTSQVSGFSFFVCFSVRTWLQEPCPQCFVLMSCLAGTFCGRDGDYCDDASLNTLHSNKLCTDVSMVSHTNAESELAVSSRPLSILQFCSDKSSPEISGAGQVKA